jgi:hypothetical protein
MVRGPLQGLTTPAAKTRRSIMKEKEEEEDVKQ